MSQTRIRLAIQKSGRLNDESMSLLARCGIRVRRHKDQLFCHSDNFQLDLLLVRDDDIPGLVRDHVCDFGIVGTNLLQEQHLQCRQDSLKALPILRELDFGVCHLAIAVPEHLPFDGLQSLNGLRIATSYPFILQEFISRRGLDVRITTLTGAVEIAPRLNIADAICDLVSTGATLEANNLKEVQGVFTSQAVLIGHPDGLPQEKQHTADIFLSRVEGSLQASGSKYIMLHAPKASLDKVVKLLPGVERPTVLTLQGDDEKVALHALCRENVFWETMEALKKAGASSILVLPVEKMMA